MSDYLNFTNYGKAILTLFKCATMDGWIVIMVDCSSNNPYC